MPTRQHALPQSLAKPCVHWVGNSIHILAHECGHVEVTNAFDRCVPNVLLRQKNGSILEQMQWQVILAVWDEKEGVRLFYTCLLFCLQRNRRLISDSPSGTVAAHPAVAHDATAEFLPHVDGSAHRPAGPDRCGAGAAGVPIAAEPRCDPGHHRTGWHDHAQRSDPDRSLLSNRRAPRSSLSLIDLRNDEFRWRRTAGVILLSYALR